MVNVQQTPKHNPLTTSPRKVHALPVTPPEKQKDGDRDTDSKKRTHHGRRQSQPQSQFHSETQLRQPTTPFTINPNLPVNDSIPAYDSPLHFSPSKARAAAQASQQVSIIKRWLTSLNSPQQPSSSSSTSTAPSSTSASTQTLISRWESEHQTLSNTNPELAAQAIQWLQDTMSLNRRADERNRLLYEVKASELEQLDQYQQQHQEQQTPADTLNPLLVIDQILQSLPPQTQSHLESLATTSTLLGHTPSPLSNPSSSSSTTTTTLQTELAHAAITHTILSQDTHTQLDTLQSQQHQLTQQLRQTETQLHQLQTERHAAAQHGRDVIHPQTAQWTRETKQITMKIKEYQDRVAVLERSRPGSGTAFHSGRRGDARKEMVRVEDVVALRDRVEERTRSVRELEDRIKMLRGLPPDVVASIDL